MRTSQMFIPTLKEIPAEAEVASHQLLLRAGFIRKVTAGVYTYLPLGQRVLAKIEKIVREEMDHAGGQEVILPIIQPAEFWQESGRWEVYGEEMFRLQDRHSRSFCLGPTHEEIITALVRSEVSSYKQLPLLLYQIQNKYRDERRPRFGLLRGREFVMKDLYSFDRDEEGLRASYTRMFEAYSNVFRRCGLSFRAVEADTGAIGGNYSHEFMVLADAGEAEVVYCPTCDYAANVEIALARPQNSGEHADLAAEIELAPTPGCQTVEEVAAYLKIRPAAIIKTLFFEADGQIIGVLLRGNRELSEVKLRRYLACRDLHLADPKRVEEVAGAPAGYVGPVGLQGLRLVGDLEVPYVVNAVVGANREGYHYLNVNPARDFKLAEVADLRQVEAGEACPHCGTPLERKHGIEVGQVFQLGTKYSRAMGATYTDARGQEQYIVMGCYGIGISRTMAAAVEQNHDANGIIWPLSIAPFQIVVVPVSTRDSEQMAVAENLYLELQQAGLEVILDDRDERAGVKFVEADLIGYPVRLTVGKKTIQSGTVDLKWREGSREVTLPREGVALRLRDEIETTCRQRYGS